jgi:hypothetical protein
VTPATIVGTREVGTSKSRLLIAVGGHSSGSECNSTRYVGNTPLSWSRIELEPEPLRGFSTLLVASDQPWVLYRIDHILYNRGSASEDLFVWLELGHKKDRDGVNPQRILLPCVVELGRYTHEWDELVKTG